MTVFKKSEEWLLRAEKTIPLGSQTFSKSRTQYPVGISPLYIEKAKGSYVWDIDGNKYIDLVSALASVTLGYSDPGMNRAIRKQLKKGISFSLPGKLEAEVAEKLISIIPSAEMVRFGKNGTDATSAAVRLARAYTGRNLVLVCGYHGWQDWYIGATTRNKGVPKNVSELTIMFPYNDLETFNEIVNSNKGKIAAVVMEPMNSTFPNPNYLEEIRRITTKEGIVLVFDETITGFRFSNGGAQEYFGVTPDLSTFGKGMANGMPLSAVVGKRDIMIEMENIFFSGTFGGELLSLAAANYVIDKFVIENIPAKLNSIGVELTLKIENLISELKLNSTLSLSGHNSWKFLNWKDSFGESSLTIKTFFMQEMFATGVLVLGTHNLNASFRKRQTQEILDSYSSVLGRISQKLISGNLAASNKVKNLEPIFKVR